MFRFTLIVVALFLGGCDTSISVNVGFGLSNKLNNPMQAESNANFQGSEESQK